MRVQDVTAPPDGAWFAREDHVGRNFLDGSSKSLGPKIRPPSNEFMRTSCITGAIGRAAASRTSGCSVCPMGSPALFAQVHPFFFFESTEMDPAICFLALRRAREYEWSISSEAFPYEFASCRASVMPRMDFTHRDRRGPRILNYEAFAPSARVSVPLTAPEDADQAYEWFKEFNWGHVGGKWRKAPFTEVTDILNAD